MASDVSKSNYRGLLLNDPRFAFDGAGGGYSSTGSSITQAGPRVGVPEAQRATPMVLETSGSQSAGKAMRIATRQGGMPGVDGAGFVWKDSADASTQWRGWDGPSAIAQWEAVVWSTVTGYYASGCLTSQSGNVFVATNTSDVDRVGQVAAVPGVGGIWRRLATTGVWNETLPGITVLPGTGCFLQLPEGRIHHYYLYEDNTVAGSEFAQCGLYYSDDDGATWVLSTLRVLTTQISVAGAFGAAASGSEIRRMRVAYSNGEVMMLIGVTSHDDDGTPPVTNQLRQYASDSLGTSFDFVGSYNPTTNADAHAAATFDVAVMGDGTFGVAYANANSFSMALAGLPRFKSFGSAWAAWSSVTSVPVWTVGGSSGIFGGEELVQSEIALAVDTTGLAVILTKYYNIGLATDGDCRAITSIDHGVTWYESVADYERVALDGRVWWDSGTTLYPTNLTATFQRGRLLIPSTHASPTTTYDGSLTCFYLGGYSTVTRPFANSTRTVGEQMLFRRTWVPWELQENVGYTVAGAGTRAILSSAAEEWVGAVTSDIVPTAAAVEFHGLVEWYTVGGNSQCDLRLGDGVNTYSIRIRQSTTLLIITDIHAASTLYSAALPAGGSYNQVYFGLRRTVGAGLNNGKLSVWIRASTLSEDRTWTQALSAVAITEAVDATANRFRCESEALATARWRIRCHSAGDNGLSVTTDSTTNPTNLFWRAYSATPVYVADGVQIAAVDGPTYTGDPNASPATADTWHIDTRYDYGIENIFWEVSPSPRRTWRSTTDATQQEIVVNFDVNEDAPLLHRVLGIGVFNANFRTMTIQSRISAAGAWGTIGTLAFNANQSVLTWVRDGRMVRPGDVQTTVYYTTNILADSHFVLEVGATLTPRTITANSEGMWSSSANAVRPVLYCADIDGTEDTVALTGEIWGKDGVLIIHDTPIFQALKFIIPVHDTAEGYFEIGTMIVGAVEYFGTQYARGRTIQDESNVALTTGRSGTRRARSLGPKRRSVSFNWANENEHDTTSIYGTPNPDYILPTGTSTDPQATPSDTGYKILGLLDQLLGSVRPVVYLPKIPKETVDTTDTTIVDRNQMMLGRIVSAGRLETVLGEEGLSEVMRIAAITIEEEV